MIRIFTLSAVCFLFFHAGANNHDCGKRCAHRAVRSGTSADYYQNSKMNLYDLKYLKLDLQVTPQSRVISGSCMYRAVVKAAMDTFAIEFRQNMLVDSVVVNGLRQNFTRNNDHIYIPFATPVAVATQLQVTFHYRGTASSAAIFSGQSSVGLRYTASVSESFQAREWFPAKQLLNDKIDSADLWFTTGSTFRVGSNGLLKEVVTLPGSLKQYRWATRYPMSYYLPSFAVANYMEYTNYATPAALAGDTIPVVHLLVDNAGYFSNVKGNLDKTPRFIETLSDLYGLYPFYNEKYGHKQASIGGGMEHQTMSTMDNFSTGLIAHELGHQWWGDYVTCATWSDIWINEGFATYSEYLTIEKLPLLYPGTTAATTMQATHNNVMTSPGGSVYIPPADAYNEGRIFNGRLSYDKGSAIIHTLRFYMQNDSVFFRTLRTFLQQYRDSFATGNDFKLVAETVSGKNLNDFFNQWYYGEGYPTYSVGYGRQGNNLLLTLSQTTSAPAVVPFFKGLVELKITSAQGDTTIIVDHQSNSQQFTIPYAKNPTGVEIDPNNWIINKVGTVVTSVSNLSASQAGIRVFPNPSKGGLTITLPPTGFNRVRILDVSGKIISTEKIRSGNMTVTTKLSGPAGVYLVQVSGQKGTVVERVLLAAD